MKATQAKQYIYLKLAHTYTHSEMNVLLRALFEDLLLKTFDPFTSDSLLLNDTQVQRLQQAVERLIKGEPIQYVTGKAHFMNMVFEVNPDVLIPRPETEELVEWIIQETRQENLLDIQAIDIGTGSGCLAISLMKYLPHIHISALDISENALQVAKENSKKLQCKIDLIHDDLLHPMKSYPSYHLIVSNPPYIPLSEMSSLDERVVNYEPHLALFEPDSEPQKFYRALIQFAHQHLQINGSVYVELHQDYAHKVVCLFEKYFNEVILKKDISGNYRMLRARELK